MVEIERKFILHGFPEEILTEEQYYAYGMKLVGEVEISQGYLSIEPEVRLHSAKDVATGKEDYRLTVKGNGTLVRPEVVTDVSLDFFREVEKMIPIKKDCQLGMIEKKYRKYAFGNYFLEVCLVDPGTVHEFYYAEIEFASEEEAGSFQVPDFLSMEVTYDELCKMKNYWQKTRL